MERVGLRLVIGYKRVRGTVALALALLLAVAGLSDGGQFLRTLALTLREHFMGKWSVHLADLLMKVSSRRWLEIGALALAVDGVFTLFEAWALRRRFQWAQWLVVIATASLLPFEIFELTRRVHAGRAALVVANLAVVVYLVRLRLADRRAHRGSAAGGVTNGGPR